MEYTEGAAEPAKILIDNIPAELRKLPHWVLWCEERRNPTDEKPTKIPYQLNGMKAKSNDPATWNTLEAVHERYEHGSYSGIGLMFADCPAHERLTGIDLDGCRDPETEEIADWARKIVDSVDSYSEVSPTGSGVKIIVRAKSPLESGKKRSLDIERVSSVKEPGVEIYDQKRFFALTGQALEHVSPRVEPRQQEVDDFCREFFPQPTVISALHNGDSRPDHPDVVKRAAKYLAKMPPAISGQGGHNTAFRTACALVKGFGLTLDEALPVYSKWNETCLPPWSEKEMQHKLEDADKVPGPTGYLRDAPVNGRPNSAISGQQTPRVSGNQPSEPEPWPDQIVSFDQLDLPAFPIDVLPDVLRRWVEAEAEATQTPPDLAGLLVLAVCGAAIARNVEVQARDGWVEPVNLFSTTLLGPGNRKSAVFADATRPLCDWEDALIKVNGPDVAKQNSQRRRKEAILKKLEKQAAEKSDPEIARQADELAAELDGIPEPVLPRLLVDDATCEQLEIMLEQQGGRIASMSAEGGVFDLMAGRYNSKMPNFVVYLKGHAGDDLKTDRVTRKGVRVKHPALTCAFVVQPSVIQDLTGNPVFRTRGLLARFLYAMPQSPVGRRKVAADPVSQGIAAEYHSTVTRLAQIPEGHRLQFTLSAQALLKDWEAEIERKLADGGRMEFMRDWGGKLAGATVRIAGILHSVRSGAIGDIQRHSLESAIQIARYLIPHAQAVLSMTAAAENRVVEDAKYLLRWIEREGRRAFSKRDAQQPCRARFPFADDIDDPLDELCKRGYIRRLPMEKAGAGRPPSPSFEVNPEVFADVMLNADAQNAQKPRQSEVQQGFEHYEHGSPQSETTDRVQTTI